MLFDATIISHKGAGTQPRSARVQCSQHATTLQYNLTKQVHAKPADAGSFALSLVTRRSQSSRRTRDGIGENFDSYWKVGKDGKKGKSWKFMSLIWLIG